MSPKDGAAKVPVNTQIVFGFSEAVNPTTINASTITVISNGAPVSGSISTGQQNTVATFTPLSNLAADSLVQVTLSGKVRDMAGNAIKGSSGPGTELITSFTTASTQDMVPPLVLSINPPNGSAGINANTAVSVTFSEPINPATVNADTFVVKVEGNAYPGQLSFSGQNAIVTFTPSQPFPANSLITVTLAAGIRDTAGNATPLPFTSTFVTAAGMDNFQPSVIKVSPYNGQTGVALSSDITLVFDERINPVSVTSTSFYVRGYVYSIGYQNIGGEITVADDGLSAASGNLKVSQTW